MTSDELTAIMERMNYELNPRTEEVVRAGRLNAGQCQYCGNEPHHSTNGACDFRFKANVAADDVRAVIQELKAAFAVEAFWSGSAKTTTLLLDMRRASRAIDELDDLGLYQMHLIALAFMTREYLRVLDAYSIAARSVEPGKNTA
jgi:hypothetical protein